MPFVKLSAVLFFVLSVCAKVLFAQDFGVDPIHSDHIEAFMESFEQDGEFDINDIYDKLTGYLERPLDLNKATDEELANSDLFNQTQIQAIIRHRVKYGDFISLHELQTIAEFDAGSIRRLIPFVTVDSKLENFNLGLGQMMVQGKNELILRMDRFLQNKQGFLNGAYTGQPFRYLFRYQHRYENRFSYGITAENDPGEDFFGGSNAQGFDFYSAHMFLRNYTKSIRSVALGDYYLRLGQGLLLFNGFSAGKSAYTANIKRSGNKLQAYRSLSEINYLRGLATTIRLNEHLEITPFVSVKKRDANILVNPEDSLDIVRFSSLQMSGLHRTEGELEDEKAISERIYGMNIQSNWNQFNVGLSGVHTKFSAPLLRRTTLPNQFDIRGNSFNGASLDYSANIRNVHMFGETAVSDNGGIATTHGMLVGLAAKTHLSLLYRNFGKNYWSLYSDPFAESTRAQNEKGLYIGFHSQMHKKISISMYADKWSHPWLRFRTNAPTQGRDYFVRVRYYKKRSTEFYVQFRSRVRQISLSETAEKIKPLADERRLQYRLHFRHHLTKSLEWRNRIEWIRYGFGGSTVSKGFMLYQDFIFKPLTLPFSFTARFALFDTDDFNSRIYAYENDILYSFFIPAYFGKGARYYLNIRYRPVRDWSFELRFEETYLTNQDHIGSGNEQIIGNKRSQVRVQLRYQF